MFTVAKDKRSTQKVLKARLMMLVEKEVPIRIIN
jgi:hypothetical protein